MYCMTSSLVHSLTGPVGTRDRSPGRHDDTAGDGCCCCCNRGTTGAAARVFVTENDERNENSKLLRPKKNIRIWDVGDEVT